MNNKLKPTPLPEDLRLALHVVLERVEAVEILNTMMPDDLLDDALDVVRCHLVGIATTDEPVKLTEPQVRGEGWSL